MSTSVRVSVPVVDRVVFVSGIPAASLSVPVSEMIGTSLVPVIVIVTVWSSVARELSVALRLYVKVNSSSLAR